VEQSVALDRVFEYVWRNVHSPVVAFSGGGPRLGELNAHEPNRQILYNQSLDERRREPWR
jgi:hypothetical protein